MENIPFWLYISSGIVKKELKIEKKKEHFKKQHKVIFIIFIKKYNVREIIILLFTIYKTKVLST